jgi:hypothetical protein
MKALKTFLKFLILKKCDMKNLYKLRNYNDLEKDTIFLYLACVSIEDQNQSNFSMVFLNLSNLEISNFLKYYDENDLEFLDFYGFEEV